ncbi:transcription initiation factor TFIID subunit 9-like [Asterias rubens]|uniref:transcription initiation factor TFIID subunit 9-like n=1 Tax=Asterias rubens TaxID=7604 RepID=UPI00145569A7|nr:transcription initiation factor TFIID subunit 9-like [Asterias rubens]
MAAAQTTKAVPTDAEVMMAILKDMGVSDYEPRLVNQMLEFTYRYMTDVLEDAQAYTGHAGRTEIDVDDVKLAIKSRLDHSFTTPPPREFLMEIARQKNNNPLPAIKPHNGPRLPPDRYCLSASNYRLRPLHKRATLTMPSRLSLSSGNKHSSNYTLTSSKHNIGSRTQTSSISLTGKGTVGSPLSIIKSSSRASSTPTINMQPSSVISRTPSTMQTVIKTEQTSSSVGGSFIALKRKREEDD